MKVAIVSFRCVQDRPTQGALRLRRVAELLAARGHDVTVYCSKWWGGNVQRFDHEGVSYRGVTICPSEPAFVSKLVPLLLAKRPAVIHVGHRPPAQVVAAATAGSIIRRPTVVEWFDATDTDTLGPKIAARRGNRIVVPSDFVQGNLLELGRSETATVEIPESIDFERIETISPDENVDIVTSRTLDGDANTESMLLALGELRGRDWEATIIGDGPRRRALEELASDLRIDDRVTFTGELTLEDRIAKFRGAHVFVQTARKELYPRELLYGLACGCVGVVEYQSNSSAHELVAGFPRGFRSTNEAELPGHIKAAQEYGHKTIDRTFEEYDHAHVLDQYVSLYRSLSK